VQASINTSRHAVSVGLQRNPLIFVRTGTHDGIVAVARRLHRAADRMIEIDQKSTSAPLINQALDLRASRDAASLASVFDHDPAATAPGRSAAGRGPRRKEPSNGTITFWYGGHVTHRGWASPRGGGPGASAEAACTRSLVGRHCGGDR
jgi:hypothetical protein